MADLKQIFEQFIKEVEPKIKAVVGSFASTIESEIKEDNKGFTIYASPYIRVLIDGRGPTREGAQRGNPTLQQAILAWIERNNITPKEPDMTRTSLSWAISKSIHKKGTLLYQRGGGNRIFDSILTNDLENNLLNLVANSYIAEITSIAGT